MKPEEKTEFVKLFTGIAELYGKNISPYLFEIYWYSLEKYSLHEVKTAAQLHAVNPDVGQFMPKPADFVRYIEGKSQERALFAWQKVISAMKLVGAYQSIIFDDKLIHHVIDEMGGWISFCRADEAKMLFIFQDFSRHYIACLSRSPNDCPSQLTGITEHQNRLFGHWVAPAIFFDGIHKISHSKLLEKLNHVKSEEINCVEKCSKTQTNS
ncbi:MAG: DUF6475 domain-containing protein [Gammaproteobacteria bacterium]|nr:DUF6475 domain-containing protein [Gammaproteobacteria bacterium]